MRAALVAVDKLMNVVSLMRELMPAPTAAAVRGRAERLAAAAGVPVAELLALTEELVRAEDGGETFRDACLAAFARRGSPTNETPAADAHDADELSDLAQRLARDAEKRGGPLDVEVKLKFPKPHVVRAPDRVEPPIEAAPPAPAPPVETALPATPPPPVRPFRMSV